MKIGRKKVAVYYNWEGIKRIQDELGLDFEEKIAQACLDTDLVTLSKILAIGTGLTAEEVQEASPPVLDVIEGITRAINLAFHGTEEPVPVNPLMARMRKILKPLTWFFRRRKPRTVTA